MEIPDLIVFWLDHTVQLTQRICVVVVAAFVSIRLDGLRRTLRLAESGWKHGLAAMAFFAVLAVLGTHSGLVIDLAQGGQVVDWRWANLDSRLSESQAIVGFRDSMTMAAGLIGGPWVGLGAGLVAGAERWWLGGFVGPASGIATLVLGLGAGLARRWFPCWATTAWGVLTVALAGSLVHRGLLLAIAGFTPRTLALTWQIVVPVVIINGLGCLLFLWIMRDLDRDRLERQVREARLAALQAQIAPHFLNNALTTIQDLIESSPGLACDILAKLARFFNRWREWADVASIPLKQELEQLDQYLELQKLRFGEKLACRRDLGPGLGDFRVPPRILQTLAENAITHGLGRTPKAPLELRIEGRARNGNLVLRVSDNGWGMPPERLDGLGKRRVESTRGGGTGLYRLAQSLDLCFGGRARLVIDSQWEVGTSVALILPARSEA